MASLSSQPAAPRLFSGASLVLHAGFIVTGIVTTLLGPILPILIGRWNLSDQRAGLFFTAQFCGSMLGVASLGWLMKRGYRRMFVLGFLLIAAGVAGLNLSGNLACLAAAGVFGCGLGQAISATNLWVAEVAEANQVAALSILNLTWGIGALVSAPLVMFAERRGATPQFLYAIAAFSALMALILAAMHLEPRIAKEKEASARQTREGIGMRSAVLLAGMFFLYVGCENSVAGWVATLTKRMHPSTGDFWALMPMFFWGGLLAGRALVPLVPLRRRERMLVGNGLALACVGIILLLQARTFASIAICVAAAGLGFAGIYPILITWLVKAFGEKSRRIGAIMFALAGLGGATMPWVVGFISTGTGSLRAGLLLPLAGCAAMLASMAAMREPVFRGAGNEHD
ncbi:MAG: MFS transporter [Candidatus Acidiferrales bacterium]